MKHNFYKHTREGEKKPLTKVAEGAKVICKHCGVMIGDDGLKTCKVYLTVSTYSITKVLNFVINISLFESRICCVQKHSQENLILFYTMLDSKYL